MQAEFGTEKTGCAGSRSTIVGEGNKQTLSEPAVQINDKKEVGMRCPHLIRAQQALEVRLAVLEHTVYGIKRGEI